MNQQIRYEVGGTLDFFCLEGRPSEATISIKTPLGEDLTTPVEDAECTIDSVNTTVDVACGVSEEDPKIIYLADTSDIAIGRKYLLTNSTGETELVQVQAINSGVSVIPVDNLKLDYLVDDSFVGSRISYALTSGNADTKDTDYLAEWSYTVDSIGYIRETAFDVVRSPWYRQADPVGFKNYSPELVNDYLLQQNQKSEAFETLLDQAFDAVIASIDSRGWRAGLIVGMNKLVIPTYEQALYMLAEGGAIPPHYKDDPFAWVSLREKRLNETLEAALSNVKWYDRDEDGVRDSGEKNRTLSSIRMKP